MSSCTIRPHFELLICNIEFEYSGVFVLSWSENVYSKCITYVNVHLTVFHILELALTVYTVYASTFMLYIIRRRLWRSVKKLMSFLFARSMHSQSRIARKAFHGLVKYKRKCWFFSSLHINKFQHIFLLSRIYFFPTPPTKLIIYSNNKNRNNKFGRTTGTNLSRLWPTKSAFQKFSFQIFFWKFGCIYSNKWNLEHTRTHTHTHTHTHRRNWILNHVIFRSLIHFLCVDLVENRKVRT